MKNNLSENPKIHSDLISTHFDQQQIIQSSSDSQQDTCPHFQQSYNYFIHNIQYGQKQCYSHYILSRCKINGIIKRITKISTTHNQLEQLPLVDDIHLKISNQKRQALKNFAYSLFTKKCTKCKQLLVKLKIAFENKQQLCRNRQKKIFIEIHKIKMALNIDKNINYKLQESIKEKYSLSEQKICKQYVSILSKMKQQMQLQSMSCCQVNELILNELEFIEISLQQKDSIQIYFEKTTNIIETLKDKIKNLQNEKQQLIKQNKSADKLISQLYKANNAKIVKDILLQFKNGPTDKQIKQIKPEIQQKNFIKSIEEAGSVSKITRISFYNCNTGMIPFALNSLTSLMYLDLRCNHIKKIQNLNNLTNLVLLGLKQNDIYKIENLDSLKKLEKLYLPVNPISIIQNLQGLDSLKYLWIDWQNIKNLKQYKLSHKIAIYDWVNNKYDEN